MSTPAVSRRLVRANLVVAAGTGLSRVTGFGRVAALAYALGQTSLTDTYNIANTMPNVVYELVLGGVLTATLVPVFVSHLDRDDDRATDAVVSVVVAVLLALTVVAVLAAPSSRTSTRSRRQPRPTRSAMRSRRSRALPPPDPLLWPHRARSRAAETRAVAPRPRPSPPSSTT